MAAVEFAWESQSISRVGCSAVARQAAKFTAVVVFPTPPFWLATAMIRAKRFLASENLAKTAPRCKMFHVEHHFDLAVEWPSLDAVVPRGTASCTDLRLTRYLQANCETFCDSSR